MRRSLNMGAGNKYGSYVFLLLQNLTSVVRVLAESKTYETTKDVVRGVADSKFSFVLVDGTECGKTIGDLVQG